jgi:exosortase
MHPMRSIAPKILFQIGILFLSFTLLFGHAIVGMIRDWSINENYSHGFLVPFITGYMIWLKKEQLIKIDSNPSNLGLLVILVGMGVFIIGNIGAELFITRTAIVITTIGLCIYSFGIRAATAIAVPLIYLMFMIPLPAIIWNKIAFPLQLFSANLTASVVHQLGIPILREGNILSLPNTTLEVVDACSGLRSLTSMLALSAPFAYIVKISNTSRWLLFLSAIPIAVTVNILRLTCTAMLATYIGPEAAKGFLHDLSGILVFVVAFMMLYGLFRLIQRAEKKILMSH